MQGDQQAQDKIVLFGGAGLVGQNLVVLLKQQGHRQIVVVDKHSSNIAILHRLHPDVSAIEADIAEPGAWQNATQGAAAAVMLQAQIGGEVEREFQRNNVDATQYAVEACRNSGVPYIVHISSSVVQSKARDWYTESKKAQERIVAESGIPHCILRPTLMFGWFDRKHLGWLSRFMQKVPVFPIPGSGRYMRQPLYAKDFCRILLQCLKARPDGAVYNITGCEKIDYVDIIREIKQVIGARAVILNVPYALFWLLLRIVALFNPNPPFTTRQLAALVTSDEFAVIPWWDIFGVTPTPFQQALQETFHDPTYSKVVLDF